MRKRLIIILISSLVIPVGIFAAKNISNLKPIPKTPVPVITNPPSIKKLEELEQKQIQDIKRSQASLLKKRAAIHKIRSATKKSIRALQKIPKK